MRWNGRRGGWHGRTGVVESRSLGQQPVRQRVRVAHVEHRQRGRRGQAGGRSIGGDRDDVRVLGVARGALAVIGRGHAPHLDLGQVAFLEAFDQHPVHAGIELGQQSMHADGAGRLELAHHGQAPVGGHGHLVSPGLTVAPGVLADVVDIEIMVRVLDHRHAQALQPQLGNQLLDQRGLAAARKPGKADHLHPDSFLLFKP